MEAEGQRGPGASPQPPAGDPLKIVTASDIVTIVHENFRQDSTAEPGKSYEVFTFDTLPVKSGKLGKRWDDAVIKPAAPAGGLGQ